MIILIMKLIVILCLKSCAVNTMIDPWRASLSLVMEHLVFNPLTAGAAYIRVFVFY